jgi:hypothetical protein
MPGDNVSIEGTLITRSPWKKNFASPSAKAAAPSAPAWWGWDSPLRNTGQ